MSAKDKITVFRVRDQGGRTQALSVMRATYRDEKHWVQADDHLVPSDDLEKDAVSWFVVRWDNQPVAVLRVLYELPVDLYREYDFKMVSHDLDLPSFVRDNRVAEIGRFAVLPEFRRHVLVAAALMREASKETIARGFTHYITDVFAGEVHSPYDFHRRVMGFQVVATHDTGELNCACRRITMLLDLRAAYRRLRAGRGWIYRLVTDGWDERLHQLMAADNPIERLASAGIGAGFQSAAKLPLETGH